MIVFRPIVRARYIIVHYRYFVVSSLKQKQRQQQKQGHRVLKQVQDDKREAEAKAPGPEPIPDQVRHLVQDDKREAEAKAGEYRDSLQWRFIKQICCFIRAKHFYNILIIIEIA